MDRELLSAVLFGEGLPCSLAFISTEDEFREALKQPKLNLILSDFTLPGFSGAKALEIAQNERPEVPFIFVSGTIGEERAVEALKRGATDYVLKSNLDRLGAAVRRAVREARERADRWQAESKLHLFRSLIDHANDAIEVVDPETGQIIDVNEKACQMRGYTREEMLGMTIFDLFPRFTQCNQSTLQEFVEDLLRTGSMIVEGCNRSKDGTIFPVEVSLKHIQLDRGYLVAVVRDITRRKHAEEGLRTSEERFRQVVENIREVFWLAAPAKKAILYISPAYERIWGRSCESLYRDPRTWLDAIHPDDQEKVIEALLHKQERGDYDEQYRVVRPDGSVRWIHDRAFPIRSEDGAPFRIAGVAEDITAQRELEEQLRQSQKMEAIGRLAGGIAHDFNNMLGIILLQSSALIASAEMDPAVKNGLHDIMSAAERAGNLTRQLLIFSRRDVKQARDIDLGEVIDTMIKLLRRILGEDIALETRFASKLPHVNADAGMMEQVIMNLSINARDAMPNGGRLSVSLDLAQLKDARPYSPHVRPGQFVRLTVSDTGEGIPPENLERIFEPFFTTKEVGKGTGLGLATVFGIVEQHRGWIEVDSEVNRGTSFRVFLPACDGPAALHADDSKRIATKGGDESILLVEDEKPLRIIASMVLQQQGYKVFAAENPEAAMEIWKQRNGAIDLVLTDLIMPGGTSGRELAERLLAEKPTLKVIYTSGYSEDIISRHLQSDTGAVFLQKPCGSATLLAAIRECLDGTFR